MVIRAHQVIAGRLTGRVRTIGLVAMRLIEGWLTLAQGTINLVSGNVEKTKILLFASVQAVPVAAGGFQEAEGTDNIGLDKIFRSVDRAIHMAFRSEIDYGAGLVAADQASHEGTIADVALNKNVPLILHQCAETLQVSRIRKYVEIDDRLVRLRKPLQYKICANEPSATGYQNHLP